MNNETQKLKNFVIRNEAYVESATWLTGQIDNVCDEYDEYTKTGVLPKKYSSEEAMFTKMLELDRRGAVEERVYDKLRTEQSDLLDD